MHYRVVDLGGETASSIRLSVEGEDRGTKYNFLWLGEVALYPAAP